MTPILYTRLETILFYGIVIEVFVTSSNFANNLCIKQEKFLYIETFHESYL